LLPDDFRASSYNSPDGYDSLLVAHVVEHMTLREAIDLIRTYLPNLRPGGRLILITPQEAGFRSDTTHVEFMDFKKLRQIQDALGLALTKEYSFPFPRFVGHLFTYNEFVSLGSKAAES
jgi:2-polyprenyl-3-methyl-5-hydroxy-6-metoxy-1,4-benzoquinol methylase